MDTIIDFKSRQGEMLLDARCSRCTASWPSITVKGARSHVGRQHSGTTCRVGEAHRRLTDEEKAARHRESVRKVRVLVGSHHAMSGTDRPTSI